MKFAKTPRLSGSWTGQGHGSLNPVPGRRSDAAQSVSRVVGRPTHGESDDTDRRGENRQPDRVALRTIAQKNPRLKPSPSLVFHAAPISSQRPFFSPSCSKSRTV